jgi:transposase
MHQKGISHREISRLLRVNRNTVRKVLKEDDTGPKGKGSSYEAHLDLMKELISRCQGNLVRVQELLQKEQDIFIPYTTLTWLVRSFDLLRPKVKRSGSYVFEPGEEMQHDTSPYKIKLGEKKINAQCASLALAYSRRLYMQFYPRFTRFEAKVFLSRSFEFMQGVCPRCVVDNTSVIVSHGTGPDATISPEMEAFGRLYQLTFVPHKVGDPNRKARIERPYSYIQNNFLAGRTFVDWDDLNAQAVAWCQETANAKHKRSLNMSPEKAYLMEKPELIPLPVHVPEVYHLEYRVVDSAGYVQLDTNRYSVPEKLLGKKVEVYKFWDKVQIFFKHKMVAEHERVLENRQARVTDPEHHHPFTRQATGPCREETLLIGDNQLLDSYVAELKKRSRGRGVQPLRRLLSLKRSYPDKPFLLAIKRAQHYGMYDLNRLEDLILQFTAKGFFDL